MRDDVVLRLFWSAVYLGATPFHNSKTGADEGLQLLRFHFYRFVQRLISHKDPQYAVRRRRDIQSSQIGICFPALELSAVLPGAMDPAGAAELYGYINAGMWTVMPQLEQLTRIPDPGLHVEVDFDSEQLRLTGRLGVSLQIRDLFAIGWAFAKPVIRWLLAMRKRQSAAEKAKAAQNAAKQRETVHTAPDGAGHTTTSTSTKES